MPLSIPVLVYSFNRLQNTDCMVSILLQIQVNKTYSSKLELSKRKETSVQMEIQSSVNLTSNFPIQIA